MAHGDRQTVETRPRALLLHSLDDLNLLCFNFHRQGLPIHHTMGVALPNQPIFLHQRIRWGWMLSRVVDSPQKNWDIKPADDDDKISLLSVRSAQPDLSLLS